MTQLETPRRRYQPAPHVRHPNRQKLRQWPRGLVLMKDQRAFEGYLKIERGAVTVVGRRRFRRGANHSQVEYGARGAWTFPVNSTREVRWETA